MGDKKRYSLSMTRNQLLIVVVVFLSLIFLWFFLQIYGLSVFCWIEAHPALASWIQAIGSIVLIAVPVWIHFRDHKIRDQERREAVARDKNAARLFLLRHAELINNFRSFSSICSRYENAYRDPQLSGVKYPNLLMFYRTSDYLEKALVGIDQLCGIEQAKGVPDSCIKFVLDLLSCSEKIKKWIDATKGLSVEYERIVLVAKSFDFINNTSTEGYDGDSYEKIAVQIAWGFYIYAKEIDGIDSEFNAWLNHDEK